MIEELRPGVPGLKHIILMTEQAPVGMHSLQQFLNSDRTGTPGGLGWEWAGPDPGDVAFIFTTGGTTAFPKGVPRTHYDYICNAVRNTGPRSYTRDTVFLINVPIAHNAALLRMVGILSEGGKIVIRPGLSDSDEIAELIQSEGVTQTHMVPTHTGGPAGLPQAEPV